MTNKPKKADELRKYPLLPIRNRLCVHPDKKGYADKVPSQLDYPQVAFEKYDTGRYWFIALCTIDEQALEAMLDGKAFHMEAGDGAVIITLDRAVEVTYG
jgi:hypothetical protein